MAQLSEELNLILKQTSRAFYLSLALLPKACRYPLSLAYLLARAADTVADSEAAPEADRLQTLRQFAAAVESPERSELPSLKDYSPEHKGEERLLDSVDFLFRELNLSPEREKEAISRVVGTLVNGMIHDINWFASDPIPYGLDTELLEGYTFSVAGCVGPFWSKICAGNDPRLQSILNYENLTTAVEFGKALQYVNILRDIPKDRLNQRYYLPPAGHSAFECRFVEVSERALRAFEDGCRYPSFYPASYIRHRWAVLLPLVLGLRTLEKLFLAGGPRQGERIKVSRTEVILWLILGPILVSHDRILQSVLQRLLKRARRALDNLEYERP